MQIQSKKIPQYLKDNGRFCNWKYELRNGNQTKVPYTLGTTRRASVSDPSTFTAFETAASEAGYDGIGIRGSGRIVGIDLDHCIEVGKLLPWAQEIVGRFHATYIEVSPSGTGVRIFCLFPNGFTYDTQTYYIKKGNTEVYIPNHTNRCFTRCPHRSVIIATLSRIMRIGSMLVYMLTKPKPAQRIPELIFKGSSKIAVPERSKSKLRN